MAKGLAVDRGLFGLQRNGIVPCVGVEVLLGLKRSLEYHMRFNFHGIYISQISHTHGFHVFKFTVAGHCSVCIH